MNKPTAPQNSPAGSRYRPIPFGEALCGTCDDTFTLTDHPTAPEYPAGPVHATGEPLAVAPSSPGEDESAVPTAREPDGSPASPAVITRVLDGLAALDADNPAQDGDDPR